MALILHLTGFRSYSSFVVQLDLGKATCISGPNGCGKTDIYRAIRWVLFAKKSDSVHPTGTSTTVRVSLKIPGLKIVRTTVPCTVSVTYRGRTHHGEDGEVLIVSLFGTRAAWELSSYVRGTHPYLTANSKERVNIINEITEEGKSRERLALLIATPKSELKHLTVKHRELLIGYEAVYQKQEPDLGKILTSEQFSAAKNDLIAARAEYQRCQRESTKKSSLTSQKKKLASSIAALGQLTREESEYLREQVRLTDILLSAQRRVQTLATSVKANAHRVTQEMIDQAVLSERDYTTSAASFSKLGVGHSEVARSDALSDCSLSLQYSHILLANSRYEELAQTCSWICKTVEECSTRDTVLLEEIATLEEWIKYGPLVGKHAEVQRLLEQVNTKLDLSSFCSQMEHALSQQSALQARRRYVTSYSSLIPGALPEQPASTVLAELEQVKAAIDCYEKSRMVMHCPHCSGSVLQNGTQLVKFEGEYSTEVDLAPLKTRMKRLNELLLLPYPAVSSVEEIASISREEERVRLAKRCMQLQNGLAPLPDNLNTLDCSVVEASARLRARKSTLVQVRACSSVLAQLDSLPKPQVVPKNVKHVPETTLRQKIGQLEKLQFHPKPSLTSATLRAQLALQEAQDELSACTKPERVTTQAEVRQYSSDLTSLELLCVQLKEVEVGLSTITISPLALLQSRKEVTDLEQRVADHEKHSVMEEKMSVIRDAAAKMDVKQTQYDRACEYKEYFDSGYEIRMRDCLVLLSSDVNTFLSDCGSAVRVELPTLTGKNKLICYNGRGRVGAPTDLSDGELSILSLAVRISFCLLSNRNLVILDEVTREMDPEAKDMCIEHVLEMMKKAEKTVLLTNHGCHMGDYDTVLDLSYRMNEHEVD